jgi:hypothetical protein
MIRTPNPLNPARQLQIIDAAFFRELSSSDPSPGTRWMVHSERTPKRVVPTRRILYGKIPSRLRRDCATISEIGQGEFFQGNPRANENRFFGVAAARIE